MSPMKIDSTPRRDRFTQDFEIGSPMRIDELDIRKRGGRTMRQESMMDLTGSPMKVDKVVEKPKKLGPAKSRSEFWIEVPVRADTGRRK
jgi:hypothetical protein